MADLRYPADFKIEYDTDYLSIDVLEYVRNKDNLISGTSNKNLATNIILPMPSNIQDANSVGWGEDKMNAISAGAFGGVDKIIENFQLAKPEDWGKVLTGGWNEAVSTSGLNVDTTKKLLSQYFAAEAVNVLGGNVSIDQILARSGGTIFNPNLELLFNGVTLRSFRFSFKMTPRDETERDNVKAIIRTLKKYMAPSKSTGEGDTKNNLYLKTPKVFDLQYRKGNKKHPFLHSFKECALKDMSVNYTGENVYATYYDGTPISIVMDLTFQELIPIYEDEYTDSLLGVGW